jgi:hypothetical protein
MTLPLRQRLIAAAAFFTALAIGVVANLDESGLAVADPGLAPVLRPGAEATAAAGGRAAWLDRGDWPEASADALRAWGDGLPAPQALTPDPVAGTARRSPMSAHSSAPAPSEATAAAPPPPPWRLIGRVDEAGLPRALLATPQQLLVVAAGDTIEGRWRVHRIHADAVELQALADGQALRLAWEAP